MALGLQTCLFPGPQSASTTKKTVARGCDFIRSYLTRSDIARREGFSDSVGDMLALNYYREALEVKGEERELFAQKGVDCATSSEAKLNLQRLLLLDTSGEEDELSVRVPPPSALRGCALVCDASDWVFQPDCAGRRQFQV